jgi:hypothetical protein
MKNKASITKLDFILLILEKIVNLAERSGEYLKDKKYE